MKFNCLLSGVVVTVVFVLATYAQESNPSPTTLTRVPWPDPLLLRGPGAQIGASFRDLTPAEAQRSDSKSPFVDRGGVVIEQVLPDSPASRAGFMKGDRITLFDGQRVRNAEEFSQLVEETPPGRTVAVRIVRDGQVRRLSITPTL